MGNKKISDELLAAYMEGKVDKKELAQVLQFVETDRELQETLEIALQLEDAEEELSLQMAAEGGRNLCDIQCEAYVLKQCGIDCGVDELLEVAKDNHWIRRAGTPLNCIGNLISHMGLKVTKKQNTSIQDVVVALDNKYKIIVAVDSDKLYPERPDEEDATNHAIVVLGVDAINEVVSIYDPGNTAVVNIKMPLFMAAWRESNCFMVCAK